MVLELGNVLMVKVRDNGQDVGQGGAVSPRSGVTRPTCPSGVLPLDTDLQTATMDRDVQSWVVEGCRQGLPSPPMHGALCPMHTHTQGTVQPGRGGAVWNSSFFSLLPSLPLSSLSQNINTS